MASSAVEHLLTEIEHLTPDERAELHRRMDSRASLPADMSPLQRLDRILLEEGIISHINPVDEYLGKADDWEPLSIEGPPISETLVQERG